MTDRTGSKRGKEGVREIHYWKDAKRQPARIPDLVIDHLTDRGVVKVEALYTSPYTDVSSQGPDGLFNPPEVDELVEILPDVRDRAVA